MSKRRPRNPFERGLFDQAPAEAIRRIVAAGRCRMTSPVYRQQMAVVDAALFTHPDYAEILQLAALADHDHGNHRP
jgi:hypothetical protein